MTLLSKITNSAPFQTQTLAVCGRSAEELSALVHQIYEAVVRPRGWPDVVGAIAQSLGGHCGTLFTPYTRPSDGGFVFPWGMDESHVLLWGTKYLEHDLWSASVAKNNLWTEGGVLLDEQMVPRDVLVQSVFYREFLVTMNIGRVCTGLLLGGSPGLPTTCLSVCRCFDAPAFSPADVAWYQMLIPHLSRALGLQHLLDDMRLQNQSLLAAFDRMAFGACVLDQSGQVVYANASAAKVFERRDGLWLDDKSILSGLDPARSSGQLTMSLKDWITLQIESTRSPAHQTSHFSQAYLQVRAQASQRYALQCSVLPGSLDNADQAGPRLVVFITDPDAVQLPPIERLMELYALTTSQARVALALAAGKSHKEAARSLNVSVNTVATHVKEVYFKVKVNRQTDLMRHILALGKASV